MKKVFLVLFLTVLTTASLNVNATDKSVTMSEDALGEAIRSYLLENPEVMAEVFENTQRYLIAEDKKHQSEVLKKNSDALYNDKRDFSIGRPDAPITVVEFFDYNNGIMPAKS